MKVDIMLVGCGGTGAAYFVKMIRFLADAILPEISVSLRIMDGDAVEYKNLGRQPFSEDDIGRNKAVALASVAEELFGINVKSYPFYLSEKTKGILQDYQSTTNVQIVIGAVDNHAARLLLHDYFQNSYVYAGNLIYLDSANEFWCGEIVVAHKSWGKILAPDRVHYFPDIFDDPGKAPFEMSCEELNAAAPQHFATNSLAADLLFAYVSQLLVVGDEMKKARGGIIWFDAAKFFSRFDLFSEGGKVHGQVK